jgi:hypothetical protein
VPFNSFSEYAPEPNPETKRKDVVWFALDEDRPLTAFAGIWTEFKGDRGTKSKPVPGPSPRQWFPNDVTKCGGRADPPESDAGDPHDPTKSATMDACVVG